MGTIYTRVTRVADWAGWCSPCEREDRPLVLTRSGPGGLRAWLTGLGDDDRVLLLTCRVCGEWQHVPAREQDDPEVVLVDDEVVEAVAAVVAQARELPIPLVLVPAPRAGQTLPVQAEELAAVEQPAFEEPVLVELPDVDVLVVAEPAAAPRPSVPRIVTVPESVVVPVPREAVEAAARVLAAARAQSQRTPSAADRVVPLDRSRRARSGPTPRHAARPAATRTPRPAAYAPITLPPAVGLPAGTHQVVVATAS